MSAAAEAAHFSEAYRLPATESADHDAGGVVTDVSADASENLNPVEHRVLKTVCLYVSFGAMVSQLERFT